ncbi:Uncharacterised protein [Mycobacterium tuberculosis]|uniref:Uncharacterized protein n=1 Tax=Mycobacterium tuberculosis TaxID=1773 RepID=A0A0U0RMJ1_MYCTX|nr:Uncharacterised protein [Mycobacterium tuberculosis]
MALPAGQRQSARTDGRLIPVRQSVDELLDVRRPGRRGNLFGRRIRAAIGDVCTDRSGEQDGIFGYQADG